MKLDLRPLLLGERHTSFDYELTVDIDSEDTASFLYGVSFPSPMKVRGDITNTAGYMRMTLTASLDYKARCARCLSEVSGSFTFDLEKAVVDYCIVVQPVLVKIGKHLSRSDGFLKVKGETAAYLG